MAALRNSLEARAAGIRRFEGYRLTFPTIENFLRVEGLKQTGRAIRENEAR